MTHCRKAHPFAEIPVAALARTHRFLVSKGYLASHLLQLLFSALKDHLAVKLQSPHVVTLFRMDMVQYLGVGKIAVKGEIAGNVPCQGIVNQVEAQRRVILEVLGRAAVLFPEPPPLDRIMTARGTDVVGNQVVVGDDVALLGMVPQPAHVLNELAAVIDQGIINGNDAVRAVAGLRVVLQPGQTAVVEHRRVPRRLDQPAIEGRIDPS